MKNRKRKRKARPLSASAEARIQAGIAADDGGGQAGARSERSQCQATAPTHSSYPRVLSASSGKSSSVSRVALPSRLSGSSTRPARWSHGDVPAIPEAQHDRAHEEEPREHGERERVGRDGVPRGQEAYVGAVGGSAHRDVVQHARERPDERQHRAGGDGDGRQDPAGVDPAEAHVHGAEEPQQQRPGDHEGVVAHAVGGLHVEDRLPALGRRVAGCTDFGRTKTAIAIITSSWDAVNAMPKQALSRVRVCSGETGALGTAPRSAVVVMSVSSQANRKARRSTRS